MNLPRIGWDEAERDGLATARAFAAFDIPAGTIRRWAHDGEFQAVGKAPGGAHLYRVGDVAEVAIRKNHKPRARDLQITDL